MKICTVVLSLLTSSTCRLLPATQLVFSSSQVQHRVDTSSNISQEEGPGNRKCFKKVMMVEQLEFQEVETCNHSYDKKCHTTYVTRYSPFEEEECSTSYKKSCVLRTDQVQEEEMVEVCRTPLLKNCSLPGPVECDNMYESECWTKYEQHQVSDDVPVCQTVSSVQCEAGECVSVPREECSVERRPVVRTTPRTGCEKVARKMCAPRGCQITQGPVECREERRSMLVDRPGEDCHMEPLTVCRPVTKMVPKLEPQEICMEVPKEICSQSKIQPKKVKKPVIKKVCMKEIPPPSPLTSPLEACMECSENTTDNCDVQNFPYTSCHYCLNNTCVPGCQYDVQCPPSYQCLSGVCRSSPGKVLVQSINIKTSECEDCQEEEAGVRLSLRGEVIGEFINGIPCWTNLLTHLDTTTFRSGQVASFDGREEEEEDREERERLGACYKAPLNAQVTGGQLEWRGPGKWRPASVCVDWLSSNMAWVCEPVSLGTSDNLWTLEKCTDIRPIQKCDQYYL